MRTSTFFREISRNIQSGTSRIGIFALIAIAGLCLVLFSDIVPVSNMITSAKEYRTSGAAVMTLSAPGRVNGESCEALTQIPDVIASGAMRKSESVSITTLPSSPIDVYEVSPSLSRVVDTVEDVGRGVYVSTDVADAVGRFGIPLTGGPVPIRGEFAYPPDGRRAGFGWAIFSPTSANGAPFDECWVLSWPQRPDIRQIVLTTLTASHSGADVEPMLQQLNTKLGASFSGTQAYASRPTQIAPYVAFVVAALLAAVSVWTRRIEIAANLHAGARRGILRIQHVLEVVVWALPAAAFAWLAGTAFSLGVSEELSSMALRCFQISFAFVAGSVIGAILSFAVVRERRLWRYVKSQ